MPLGTTACPNPSLPIALPDATRNSFPACWTKYRTGCSSTSCKKQGILEIAAEYNLIDNANNKLIPFSREWFFYEMQSKSPTKIAKETRRPYSEICQMMDALGIDRSQRRAEIDPGLLRYLSLELYWSDEEIAAQVHLPVTAITQQRRSEGIHMKDRDSAGKEIATGLIFQAVPGRKPDCRANCKTPAHKPYPYP